MERLPLLNNERPDFAEAYELKKPDDDNKMNDPDAMLNTSSLALPIMHLAFVMPESKNCCNQSKKGKKKKKEIREQQKLVREIFHGFHLDICKHQPLRGL